LVISLGRAASAFAGAVCRSACVGGLERAVAVAAEQPAVFEVPAGAIVVGLDLVGAARLAAALAVAVPAQQQPVTEPFL
jgi:predicted dinucleotide-utilizing enzyme